MIEMVTVKVTYRIDDSLGDSPVRTLDVTIPSWEWNAMDYTEKRDLCAIRLANQLLMKFDREEP